MIKFIIAQGIGFSPGSVKYIPTFGFIAATPPAASDNGNRKIGIGMGVRI